MRRDAEVRIAIALDDLGRERHPEADCGKWCNTRAGRPEHGAHTSPIIDPDSEVGHGEAIRLNELRVVCKGAVRGKIDEPTRDPDEGSGGQGGDLTTGPGLGGSI